MAASTINNATYIKIAIGTKELIGETSTSISSSVDVIDVSSKESGRTRRIIPGRVSENVSFESLCDDLNTTDYGYSDAHGALKAGTLVSCTIKRYDSSGTQVEGSKAYTFDGYITSLTKDNPDNDRSTMSGTIEIDGAVTISTYTA